MANEAKRNALSGAPVLPNAGAGVVVLPNAAGGIIPADGVGVVPGGDGFLAPDGIPAPMVTPAQAPQHPVRPKSTGGKQRGRRLFGFLASNNEEPPAPVATPVQAPRPPIRPKSTRRKQRATRFEDEYH